MGIVHPSGSCAGRGRSRGLRAFVASAALAATMVLAGCDTDSTDFSARALKPLSPAMLSELERKNMPKESPIVVRLFKEESELEVWKQDTSQHFVLLKTYPICRWSGELGPKTREGDRQAPEGFYTITPAQMNPNSHYYLSFDIGYPNAFDRGYGRTGSNLMVHGDCSSRGCYAMTDEQIAEIYALARESFFGGQRSFQVQAYPFRMTALNMARHRNNPNMPFWKMLKEGNDHFEVSGLEPKVDVCERRYVFDAEAPANASPVANAPKGGGDWASVRTAAASEPAPLHFSPNDRCPAYEVRRDIAAAIAQKQHKDEVETAELISHGTPTVPIRTGTDGGTNSAFLSTYQPEQVRDPDGTVRTVVERRSPNALATALGSLRRDTDAVTAEPPTGTLAPSVPAPQHPASATPVPPGGGKYGVASSESRPVSDESKPVSGSAAAAGGEPHEESGNLFTRLFRMVGGDDKKAEASAAAAPPAAKPAAAGRHAPGAIAAKPRSKPEPKAEPDTPPSQQAQAQQAQTQQAQAVSPPKIATSTDTASTGNGGAALMTGAQPVVPTGTFDSRWSAIR